MKTLWLHFKFWIDFKLICLEKRAYQKNHPFSIEKQDSLQARLDYLIFEALASASITQKQNLLTGITHWPLVLRSVHETIQESYPDFYQKHLNEFKVIANLCDTLRDECRSLTRLEEWRFKEPLINHPNVNRIYALCHDLYDRYSAIYDGSFNEDCVHIMNDEERDYYLTEFSSVRKGNLLRSA